MVPTIGAVHSEAAIVAEKEAEDQDDLTVLSRDRGETSLDDLLPPRPVTLVDEYGSILAARSAPTRTSAPSTLADVVRGFLRPSVR